MARYRLDDRGILTITDDQDGILSPVAGFARMAAILLLCLTAVGSVVLYCAIYLPREDTFTALTYCAERLAGCSPLSTLEEPLESAHLFEEAQDVLGGAAVILGGLLQFLWDAAVRLFEAAAEWLASL